MDRRIVYTRPDGGVSIVTPCRNIGEDHLTDDDIFQRAMDKLPVGAMHPQAITVDDIPQDRDFREAWEHTDKIQVNMDKARIIHLGRIRTARDAALATMDIETIKAAGKGDSEALAAVETKKRAIRDLPQTIDLTKANTPEELKAIWPEELK